jgi:hypothetical protein
MTDSWIFVVIGMFLVISVLYFGVDKPQLDKCRDQGGVIVRIDGYDKCVEPPTEIKK